MVALLVHLFLMIPIFLKRRQHENQEFAQQAATNPDQVSKSLENFLLHCFMMFCGTLALCNVLFIMNRYELILYTQIPLGN